MSNMYLHSACPLFSSFLTPPFLPTLLSPYSPSPSFSLLSLSSISLYFPCSPFPPFLSTLPPLPLSHPMSICDLLPLINNLLKSPIHTLLLITFPLSFSL